MKKIIAMLLALVMVFALCACGSQPAAEQTPQQKSPRLPQRKLPLPQRTPSPLWFPL